MLRTVRLAVGTIAVVVIAGCLMILGYFVFQPERAAEYTAGLRPAIYYAPLAEDDFDPALQDDYERVFGVAHNSGDSLEATIAALAAGADAIEIDVISLDGQLYSSHRPPIPWGGLAVFRGPSLLSIWTAAAQTDLVKFDLKESSLSFLELVVAFLSERRTSQQVVIASSDPAALRFLANRVPDLLLLASVGSRDTLETLQGDAGLAGLIDGVTIREDLVDEETARWLHERELSILAWTVNDLARANELIRLGVDGITTDNLALLTLLGGQRQRESQLETSGSTPVAVGIRPTTRIPQGTSRRVSSERTPRPIGRRRAGRRQRSQPAAARGAGPAGCRRSSGATRPAG